MAKAKGKTDKKDLTPIENLDLQSDLKRFGYLLPTNEEEAEEFNKLFGKTQVIFPDRLMEPSFLKKSEQEKPAKPKVPTKKIERVASAKKPSGKSDNDYFKRLVLAAHVADELCSERTFGHVKFVKVYMLCDKVCHMNLRSSYARHAAGPLDPKQMYTFDGEFRRRQWFTITKTAYGYKYEPSEKIDDYRIWYPRYFKNELADIARIIELFRKQNSDFCEIVATMFFVWMESISKRQLVNNASLIRDFYDWSEEKKKFNEKQLVDAIEWMNENRIVPI